MKDNHCFSKKHTFKQGFLIQGNYLRVDSQRNRGKVEEIIHGRRKEINKRTVVLWVTETGSWEENKRMSSSRSDTT